MVPTDLLLAATGIIQAIAAGALFFCSLKASQLWTSALDAQLAAQRERGRLERERRRPSSDDDPHRCSMCGRPLGETARLADASFCERCRRDPYAGLQAAAEPSDTELRFPVRDR